MMFKMTSISDPGHWSSKLCDEKLYDEKRRGEREREGGLEWLKLFTSFRSRIEVINTKDLSCTFLASPISTNLAIRGRPRQHLRQSKLQSHTVKKTCPELIETNCTGKQFKWVAQHVRIHLGWPAATCSYIFRFRLYHLYHIISCHILSHINRTILTPKCIPGFASFLFNVLAPWSGNSLKASRRSLWSALDLMTSPRVMGPKAPALQLCQSSSIRLKGAHDDVADVVGVSMTLEPPKEWRHSSMTSTMAWCMSEDDEQPRCQVASPSTSFGNACLMWLVRLHFLARFGTKKTKSVAALDKCCRA